ncbi:MAG: glycosyltransferase [Flavobacteriales bacterium]
MSASVAIITPVFNDWESYNKLVDNTTALLAEKFSFDRILFVAVDDCSSQEVIVENAKANVKLISLNRNVGHQKAIAVGLSYAAFNLKEFDFFIVMDSDGEDKPEDVIRLIDKSEISKQIVFAKRSKRSESTLFKFFYKIYKLVFKLLTGQSIYFGNFSVIPSKYIQKIVHVSEIWNHYSGAVIRSRLPYTTVDSERGKRYFGQSKMNFTNLVLHGLSAVSIYMDQMAVRLLFLTIFLILFTISGVLVVLTMKFITHVAIPGWASVTILALSIIFFQAFFIGLFMVFSVLSYRTNRSIIPAKDYKDFVLEVIDYARK